MPALREQAGLDVATLRPASDGESGTTFWATGRDGSVSVVKVMQEAAGGTNRSQAGLMDRLGALPGVVGRLRERGYPAARILGVWAGVPGLVFWVQERLPGTVLDPGAGPAAVTQMLRAHGAAALRYHPGAAATRRHLELARLVVADLGD